MSLGPLGREIPPPPPLPISTEVRSVGAPFVVRKGREKKPSLSRPEGGGKRRVEAEESLRMGEGIASAAGRCESSCHGYLYYQRPLLGSNCCSQISGGKWRPKSQLSFLVRNLARTVLGLRWIGLALAGGRAGARRKLEGKRGSGRGRKNRDSSEISSISSSSWENWRPTTSAERVTVEGQEENR